MSDPKGSIEVAHIVAYYPPHLGGMELRVKDLATLQASQGIKTTVFTSNIGIPKGTPAIQDGVQISYIRALEFAHTPIMPSIIWHLFRIKRSTIIHLHVAHVLLPEIVAMTAKIRGMQYIAHIRLVFTQSPSGPLGRVLPIYERLILGPVLRQAAKVIVLTEGNREVVHQRFDVPFDKIVIIPNATSFKISDQSKISPHKPLRLLAVGRIASQKNYPFILKIVSTLKEKNLDVVLTVVGSDPGLSEIEAYAKELGLKDDVRFLGQKNGRELERIYEECDLLIHASLIEGFSTVLLEGMSKGLPIVASDIFGTRDVIKDPRNGFLVSLDIEKMCDAIVRLVHDPDLYKKISLNNIEDVRLYDWDIICNRTLDIYRDLKKANL